MTQTGKSGIRPRPPTMTTRESLIIFMTVWVFYLVFSWWMVTKPLPVPDEELILILETPIFSEHLLHRGVELTHLGCEL